MPPGVPPFICVRALRRRGGTGDSSCAVAATAAMGAEAAARSAMAAAAATTAAMGAEAATCDATLADDRCIEHFRPLAGRVPLERPATRDDDRSIEHHGPQAGRAPVPWGCVDA
jgi:hypothetical protein